MRAFCGLLAASLFATACDGLSSDPSAEADAGVGEVDLASGVDDVGSSDMGAVVDLGPVDAGPLDVGAEDMGPPPEPDVCDALDLPRHAFRTDDVGFAFGQVAGDFTVNELGGRVWNLRDAFTGCESYTFLTYFSPGATGTQTGAQIFTSNPLPLVRAPLNAHFFMTSFEAEARFREQRMTIWRDNVQAAIDQVIPEAEREANLARFHFVTDRVTEIEGSVGAFMIDYLTYAQNPANLVDLGDRGRAPPPIPYFFAVDRNQEWDSGGSPARFVGGPASAEMASYLPAFFDYKAALDDRLASEDGVTEVVLLEEAVTDRVFTREVMLPDASTMAGFDTLEIDVSVFCGERNVFACSEWDRIGRVSYCLDAECTERREIARWITPYWRRGGRRWAMDASALLPYMAEGGAQTFYIEMGPGWERPTERDARFALRFSNRSRAEAAFGVQRVYTGGNFDAAYNDRDEVSFTPPADATRVELVSILSGHGQAEQTNCSEWCDHRHAFTVNGQDLPVIRSRAGIGSTNGCAVDAAGKGASPGQWGNWAPQRAFWCPGAVVEPIRQDITSQVTLSAENTLDYRATLGASGAPGGGNISLSTYVVWYR